ncbi:MAG TPA: RdgB/HAM1 family non-canonical purine NTP pyrophosphatase [Acidimicrobiia bacterium]
MTRRVVVATANPDKAREMRAVLAEAGLAIELVDRPPDVPEVEETGATLEENSRLKADALRDATGLPAIADDTGLEVDALDGAPGVLSARYAGPRASYGENVRKLLAELASRPDATRSARFRTVVVLAQVDGSEIVASGTVEGEIIDHTRGDQGFGYDPVFVPAAAGGETFAQMEPARKHALSHRGQALRTLAVRMREAGWPTEARGE